MTTETSLFRTVSSSIARLLDARGFRRHKLGRPTTFTRRDGDVTQIVAWARHREMLDVFLGVHHALFALVQHGAEEPDPSSVHLGFHLSAVADDHPVLLKAQQRILLTPATKSLVEGVLLGRGLPLLEKTTSHSWIGENLLGNSAPSRPPVLFVSIPSHICAAVLCVERQERERAETILKESFERAVREHKPHAEQILNVARRLGLQLLPVMPGGRGLTER